MCKRITVLSGAPKRGGVGKTRTHTLAAIAAAYATARKIDAVTSYQDRVLSDIPDVTPPVPFDGGRCA